MLFCDILTIVVIIKVPHRNMILINTEFFNRINKSIIKWFGIGIWVPVN